MNIRVLDLFAGIGGFTLGLKRQNGFETIGFSEIRPFQNAVLRKNFPGIPNLGDIRKISEVDCDMICGGFPCQPFSTASRGRKVAEDLWPEMFRVISINIPDFVIAENVQESPIRKAENDLRELGHRVTVRNISGHDCGAPHGRSRWWAVAHPYDEGEFQRALDAEVARLPELCKGLWDAETYRRAIRIPDGVPTRMDEPRRVALGNTVMPVIPQCIGNAINLLRGWP